jgi:hypothetical protein
VSDGAPLNVDPLNWAQGRRQTLPPLVLSGTRADMGEPSATVAYSEPRCWLRPSRALTRDEHELWQLGQFLQDFYVGTGEWLAPEGVVKGESPDFKVLRSALKLPPLGVELAVFTPTQRRAMEPIARGLRDDIAADGASYAHLAGCHVTLSIDPQSSLAVVARRHRAALLQALRDAERPPTLLDRHGLPAGYRTLGQGTGWSLSAYELVPRDQLEWHDFAVPLLTVSSAIETTVREIAEELQRTVREHDYAGVDWLIVPTFAPDRHGLATFEDEALIQELLGRSDEVPLDLSDVRCRVMLHGWVDGRITQLTPQRLEVCPGRCEHERKLTAITYNRFGDMFCSPLSSPAVRVMQEP